MGTEFEWDVAKAEANLRKHRVSFEEAVTAFSDVLSSTVTDPLHSKAKRDTYCLVKPARVASSSWSTQTEMRKFA